MKEQHFLFAHLDLVATVPLEGGMVHNRLWAADDWQSFCHQLVQLRHGSQNVQCVPDAVKGDAGIEFIFIEGTLYQCYAPEEVAHTQKAATAQKAKARADLNKLEKYKDLIEDLLAGLKINRWILLTPFLDDKSVVADVRQHGLKIRGKALPFITDDFEALIHSQKDFESEIAELRNKSAMPLRVAISHPEDIELQQGGPICPTCHQDVSNELLPAIEHAGMGLEENIAFIKSQIQLYETAYRGAVSRVQDWRARYRSNEDELKEKQSELRALRQALVQPNSAPTRVMIEEIVRTQAFVDRVKSFEETASIATEELRAIAAEWASLSDQIKRLPRDELTDEDNNKIILFQNSIQVALALYDFKSFSPNEIILSRDNFRPLASTRSGAEYVEKEINFEVSASDGIRLKWAYYLSLLSLSVEHRTNHAGVAIFDEPGQQEIEAGSLYAFLRDTANRTGANHQAIVSTSEPLSAIADIGTEGANIVSFDGFMLQPIGDELSSILG